MQERSKIQGLKRIIKISIAMLIIAVLVILGLFVKNARTFENSSMDRWLVLSESQQIDAVYKVAPEFDDDMGLLLNCVTKIARIPDSGSMNIRDAISLCYNGMKINSETLTEGLENNDTEKKDK